MSVAAITAFIKKISNLPLHRLPDVIVFLAERWSGTLAGFVVGGGSSWLGAPDWLSVGLGVPAFSFGLYLHDEWIKAEQARVAPPIEGEAAAPELIGNRANQRTH